MKLSRREFLASAAASAAFGAVPLSAQSPLKVGFIYFGPVGDYGWTYSHDLGRRRLEAELGSIVETSYVENVAEDENSERMMREMVRQGHKIIFATSYGYMNHAVKVAQEFPEVKFEHATGIQRLTNLATYNSRFYQGRAITGTIAGHMTKTGILGYLASFPVPEVVMGINAFTLAARKVNPKIVCKVIWANTWFDPAREAEVARTLIDQGADIITTHTDSPAALQVAEDAGLYGFGQGEDMSSFAPRAHLTAIVNNWAPYYTSRVRAIIEGTWISGDTWWGMRDDAVRIAPYNADMPDKVKVAAETVRTGILAGAYDPFAGPVNEQSGRERVMPGATLDDSQLVGMNWYVEGVQS